MSQFIQELQEIHKNLKALQRRVRQWQSPFSIAEVHNVLESMADPEEKLQVLLRQTKEVGLRSRLYEMTQAAGRRSPANLVAFKEQVLILEAYLADASTPPDRIASGVADLIHRLSQIVDALNALVLEARGTVPTGTETPAPSTARDVQIGGGVQGSVIITGDGNMVTVGTPSAARPQAGRGPAGVERAVLRIYAADGKSVVGAGFLVEGRQALTCDHVVAQALAGGEVRADFPLFTPGRILTARAVRRDSDADVAVLELMDDPPEQACPVHLIVADDLWGHPFRAFGFPAGHPEGVWAAGVIRGPNARGWLQIEDTTVTGYRVQPGFSGTPVWDETLEGVVGMVVTAERDPAVRAAAIIPASRLPVQCTPEGPRASNPFCDRGRINDPARLFDRERILRELRDLLAGGNSVSLVGEPQIGKSSVLCALYRTAGEWFPGGIVHYVDLQGVLDEADFCAEVLEGMGREPGDLRALRRALRRQRVVLLLDEVEKLARPAFSRDLHDLLRALAQELTLTLAVASHRPLVEVFPPSSDTSPFHNIFTEKQLGPFSPAEARAFLHHRLQGTGVAFTAEEVEQLVMESGGHPARLQGLAYVLFEAKQ